jgi:hypothetical protein
MTGEIAAPATQLQTWYLALRRDAPLLTPKPTWARGRELRPGMAAACPAPLSNPNIENNPMHSSPAVAGIHGSREKQFASSGKSLAISYDPSNPNDWRARSKSGQLRSGEDSILATLDNVVALRVPCRTRGPSLNPLLLGPDSARRGAPR